MSPQSSLGLEPSMIDNPSHLLSHHPAPTSSMSAHMPSSNPDWIPPPASVATVNSDAIDLNDEVFFNYNSLPSYTTSSDPYALGQVMAASSSSSSLANAPYNALQHELSTPDLSMSSPLQFSSAPSYPHNRRFSSAVEQLNRMTLRGHNSKSPSPDMYSAILDSHEKLEERTINPRQLLGGMSSAVNGSRSVAVSVSSAQNNSSLSSSATRYILPSSVSSPSLSTFFSKSSSFNEFSDLSSADAHMSEITSPGSASDHSHHTLSSKGASALNNPMNPYVMNDECVSAITYWLNNTADVISEKTDRNIIRNPTGIMKPSWNRRNSIQVMSPRGEDGSLPRTSSLQQKRKRRRSVNMSIPELPLLSDASDKTQHNDTLPPTYEGTDGSAIDAALDFESALHTNDAVSVQDAPDLETMKVGGLDSNKMHLGDKQPDSNEFREPVPVSRTNSMQAIVPEGDDEPKPFPCPECEKQFKRSEHLKRHIRSVHSNIRPFHCKYCDKKFSRSDNLAQHSKTHFKVNSNGTTTVIYGNPNPHNRGGRKKSTAESIESSL